ncbi:DUF1360 domain-containing protein [Brevibacillus sp. TJ4]|uniref:DUF1360 domain-containing protein n=1 Tax=Brevibacillus sp. TJ4 TaxID=3234853 RepID=UPI0037D13DD4
MLGMTWLDLTILVLASFRLTHLIVFDEIASFVRAPFLTVTYEPDATGQLVRTVHIKGTGLRYWIGSLLSCHWCVGIWTTAALVALYFHVPLSYPLILILAIAGAAAVIETKMYFG